MPSEVVKNFPFVFFADNIGLVAHEIQSILIARLERVPYNRVIVCVWHTLHEKVIILCELINQGPILVLLREDLNDAFGLSAMLSAYYLIIDFSIRIFIQFK